MIERLESDKSQVESRRSEEVSRNNTTNGNHNGNGHHTNGNGSDEHHHNGHANGQANGKTNGNPADTGVNGHQIEKRLEELEQVKISSTKLATPTILNIDWILFWRKIKP